MKILFYILSAIILIGVIFFACINSQIAFQMSIINIKGQLISHNVNLIQIIAFIFVSGILTGSFWAAAFYTPTQKKLKEYQRKLEKTSVNCSEESSKVSVLEAKIATLEKALDSALNKD